MDKENRLPIRNLATVYNKPYPPPKTWMRIVLMRGSQRITSMPIPADRFEIMEAGFRKQGVRLEVESD